MVITLSNKLLVDMLVGGTRQLLPNLLSKPLREVMITMASSKLNNLKHLVDLQVPLITRVITTNKDKVILRMVMAVITPLHLNLVMLSLSQGMINSKVMVILRKDIMLLTKPPRGKLHLMELKVIIPVKHLYQFSHLLHSLVMVNSLALIQVIRPKVLPSQDMGFLQLPNQGMLLNRLDMHLLVMDLLKFRNLLSARQHMHSSPNSLLLLPKVAMPSLYLCSQGMPKLVMLNQIPGLSGLHLLLMVPQGMPNHRMVHRRLLSQDMEGSSHQRIVALMEVVILSRLLQRTLVRQRQQHLRQFSPVVGLLKPHPRVNVTNRFN